MANLVVNCAVHARLPWPKPPPLMTLIAFPGPASAWLLHRLTWVTWVMRLQGLPRNMKRCLAGMKEVAWAVNEPGRAKLVLIAPNIQIPCPDSVLLDQVLELVAKCRKADVPVIMGPSRKQLGMAFRTSGAVLLHHSVCLRLAFTLSAGQVSPMHSNLPKDS